MKIAGKIIQDRFIYENTEYKFDASYKKHRIIIEKSSETSQGNPIYWAECFGDRNGEYKFKGCIRRCNMRDVIIALLNDVNL
jgi:hypothetical protein